MRARPVRLPGTARSSASLGCLKTAQCSLWQTLCGVVMQSDSPRNRAHQRWSQAAALCSCSGRSALLLIQQAQNLFSRRLHRPCLLFELDRDQEQGLSRRPRAGAAEHDRLLADVQRRLRGSVEHPDCSLSMSRSGCRRYSPGFCCTRESGPSMSSTLQSDLVSRFMTALCCSAAARYALIISCLSCSTPGLHPTRRPLHIIRTASSPPLPVQSLPDGSLRPQSAPGTAHAAPQHRNALLSFHVSPHVTNSTPCYTLR